jgi:hypothetical protein
MQAVVKAASLYFCLIYFLPLLTFSCIMFLQTFVVQFLSFSIILGYFMLIMYRFA